jgi:TM2 domain-containing membrane protein YozV
VCVVPTKTRPSQQPYKNPAFALALAAMCPGSGQLWVGHLGRGLLMFFLSFACCVGYFWGMYDAYKLAEKANRGEVTASDKYVWHAYLTLPLVLLAILMGLAGYVVWLEWSSIQTYIEQLLFITEI